MRRALLIALLCLALPGCARPGLERIALICIERLPAGKLGAWGARPSLTPHLDRLAAEGVRFETVIAPSLLQAPAHATLETGQDPPRHGVRREGEALDASTPTLLHAARRRGLRIATEIEGELEAQDFLFLHLGTREGEGAMEDAQLAEVDARIGRFLDAFDRSLGDGEGLVVVVGSRARGSAGWRLRDEDLRVPLILRGMGLPQGRVVSVPVRLADVAPTVAVLARLSSLPGADGRSLLPLVAGRAMPWPYAFAESAERSMLRSADWKLLRDPSGARLIDLAADPEERGDVGSEHPEELARLRELLAGRLAGGSAP